MKYYNFLFVGIFGLVAVGCAENPAKPQTTQQSFPEGSAVRAVQSGPLGSTFSGEDLVALEKGLTTVHPRKPTLDQWTTSGGHRIRIDNNNFGRKQNTFCMKATIFLDEKEALPETPICKRGGWWRVVPESELAEMVVPEKQSAVATVKPAKSDKKTPAAPIKVPEKAYILN